MLLSMLFGQFPFLEKLFALDFRAVFSTMMTACNHGHWERSCCQARSAAVA
jgi:hypothetical protein